MKLWFKMESLYVLLRPDAHMANVYVYGMAAIAAGILLNCRMQAANYTHVPWLTEEK